MTFTGPLEDRIAIRELLETYADAVCRVDDEAWGSTWAEDGVWEMPDYPGMGAITGRANIVAFWKLAMEGFPGLVFTATPGSIVVDGDEAQVVSYTTEVYDRDAVTRRDLGRYEDILVKRTGLWFFKARRFRYIHRQLRQGPRDADGASVYT